MSRSVWVPDNAVAVAYRDVSDIGYEYWEDDFIEWVRDSAKELFPSMSADDSWIEWEARSVMENDFAMVVVSEYMGLAAVSLVLKEYSEFNPEGLVNRWVPGAVEKFHKRFAEYRRVAAFSNGEVMYERIEDL